MARKYARSNRKVSRTKRTYKRRTGYRRNGYRTLSRRISAISKRVAGEVCKFEITPNRFSNSLVTVGTSSQLQRPLTTITSGTPWVMPLNWIYQSVSGNGQSSVYIDGQLRVNGEVITASIKNPLWYNTLEGSTDTSPNGTDSLINSPGLQYRLKYIYINALFNASVASSQNNTDGALRIVVIRDKQPTGGAATWADLNSTENSRGVFNANRIDAQLNPNTVGRFSVMYDKTLRFTTINGYKPFKYYKALSTIVRNNRGLLDSEDPSYDELSSALNYIQSSSASPPVQKNAYYLMMFPDGVNFNYTDQSETVPGGFHLFNRVAYYNN